MKIFNCFLHLFKKEKNKEKKVVAIICGDIHEYYAYMLELESKGNTIHKRSVDSYEFHNGNIYMYVNSINSVKGYVIDEIKEIGSYNNRKDLARLKDEISFNLNRRK